jgi:hypothetical protein
MLSLPLASQWDQKNSAERVRRVTVHNRGENRPDTAYRTCLRRRLAETSPQLAVYQGMLPE